MISTEMNQLPTLEEYKWILRELQGQITTQILTQQLRRKSEQGKHLMSSPYLFFPSVLLTIFKQLQTIYFIVICVILYFKYCTGSSGNAISQACFLLFYIMLEVFIRYFTYRQNTKRIYHDDEEYRLWWWGKKKWVKIKEEDIKVGQIIKISASKDTEKNKIRVPVHLLPLGVESKAMEVKIDTFYIDKKQRTTSIEILPEFRKKLVDCHHVETDIQRVRIQYTFHSPISESFQAKVIIDDQVKKLIDNQFTIPKGAYFRGEECLVGVVMHSLEQNSTKHLTKVLQSDNRITTLLQHHLFFLIIANIFFTILYLGINMVWQRIILDDLLVDALPCYPTNMLGMLSYSVNVFMFLLLSLHRLVDYIKIRNKCDIRMKNYIKGFDQFGKVDTFVLDQFSIVRKNMLKIVPNDITINDDIHGVLFDRESILFCVHRSEKFQSRFASEWRAINNLIQAEPLSISLHDISIQEEIIDIDGSIVMVVVFNRFLHNPTQNCRYMVRFNQKIIFSVLESMNITQQLQFTDKINQSKRNGEIMITMEVTELEEAIRSSMSHSNMYEINYRFYSLLKMKFMINHEATNFLKQIKKNYKIAMMTSGSLQHFEKILAASELKNEKDRIFNLEEMQESQFRRQLRSLFVQTGKNQPHNGSTLSCDNDKTKKGILAIHSSLVAYLSREDIRKMIRHLSSSCIYLVFYECSQFQKQLCVASLFKIFPQHIFLSNFAVDSNLFRTSNLSISLANKSAQPYATAAAISYTSLEQFIKKESVRSIALTSIIIKNQIFKNQVLIGALIMLTFLIYRGGMFIVGQQYSPYLFILYNWMLTFLPLLYYVIGKPSLLEDIVIEDYKDFRFFNQHFFGIFSGVMITVLTYLLTPYLDIQNIFISVLLNCTLIANLNYLVLDDSISKYKQIILIVVQEILAAIFYIATSFLLPSNSIFHSGLEILSLQIENNFMFFVVTFGALPICIFLWLLFLSFHRSVRTRDQRREKHEQEEINQRKEISTQDVLLRIGKSTGKQMKFRFRQEDY